jgi:hypothetical protein
MNDEYEFNTRSPEEIVLAIFDKLGVKLSRYHLFYIGY